MIITLFFIALIISGIAVFCYEYHEYCSGDNVYTYLSCFIGSIGLFICITFIICAHVGVDNSIEVYRIRKESIEQRYDTMTSQYEDISDISVLQEVEEWNVDVTRYKYWCNHPMTSWFFSKDVAKSLELIDMTK